MGLHSLLTMTPNILCNLTFIVKRGNSLTDDREFAFVTQNPLEAACILDREDQNGDVVLTGQGHRRSIHDLQIF